MNQGIDVDTDNIPEVEKAIAAYGQQATVTIRRNPWTGPGGGYISSVELAWISDKTNAERFTISLMPEGRTGSGSLRYNRNAGIGFAVGSAFPCN
jgi:hypothetical protein